MQSRSFAADSVAVNKARSVVPVEALELDRPRERCSYPAAPRAASHSLTNVFGRS